MPKVVIAVLLCLVLGAQAPARAETVGADRSPSITIDLATVGGGALGLIIASGMVGLYNAVSFMSQGAPAVEALEAGAGLPVMAAVVAVIAGGVLARDIVANEILPLFAPAEHGKPAH